MLREWCREEQTGLSARRPGLRRLLLRAEARASVLVGLLAFAVLLAVQLTTSHGDAGLFAAAGARLLHGHADVFEASLLQVGPAYLLLIGPGALAADAVGAPQWAGSAVLTSAATAVLLVAVLRSLGTPDLRPGRTLLAGVAAILGGAVAIPASYGHPEEVMTALLLVLATHQSFHRRTIAPALLLAAAITIKLWAVVGVGLLLVKATRRSAVLRGAVLGGCVAAAYLPFAVLGRIATFDYMWVVEVPAPLSLVFETSSPFGYERRLLQVVLAAGIGALVAWRARGIDVVWALPLAVIAARVLLDPLSNPYYWTTLVVVVVLRQVLADRPLLESLVLAYLTDIALLLLITTAQGTLGAIALAAFGLGVLAWVLVPLLTSPTSESRRLVGDGPLTQGPAAPHAA